MPAIQILLVITIFHNPNIVTTSYVPFPTVEKCQLFADAIFSESLSAAKKGSPEADGIYGCVDFKPNGKYVFPQKVPSN